MDRAPAIEPLNGPLPEGSRTVSRSLANSLAIATIALLLSSCLGLTRPLSAADLDGFHRGDCNGDGAWDLGDPIGLLIWLLSDGPDPHCSDGCDVNDDGTLDISDSIYALSALFTEGTPPPLPYPDCGLDPTADSLSCESPACTLTPDVRLVSFVLPTTHVGVPYSAALPENAVDSVEHLASGTTLVDAIPFTTYGIEATSVLPEGLFLDSVGGRIVGVPTTAGWHRFRVWAIDTAGDTSLISLDLAVFSADEGEIVPDQSFRDPGPYPVTIVSGSFLHVHDLPWPPPYELWDCTPNPPPVAEVQTAKQLRFHVPVFTAGARPLLLFHHGAGFDHADYDVLLSHIASHGFICASVNDAYSFTTFQSHYCWGGHLEAARVLISARAAIEELALDPAHPLAGKIDLDRVFYGGHSRGGSSALLAAEIDPRTRGVIALQPTDARGDSFIGSTDRLDRLPPLPFLDISAEQDTDVVFPWAERLLERADHAMSLVTIYGGCHGYSTDDRDDGCFPCGWVPSVPEVDRCLYITREQQIELSAHFSVAFLRRYGLGDLSLEGQLAGQEWNGSPLLSLASRRNLASTIWVDDFAAYPLRTDGNEWTVSGVGTATVGACYDSPNSLNAPPIAIENLICQFPATGEELAVGTQLEVAGVPLDVSGRAAVVFRLKNHDRWQLPDNFGFSWLDARIELTDALGRIATISLGEFLPAATSHPQSTPSGVLLKAQRFLDVRIPLARCLELDPLFDLGALTELRFRWRVAPGATVITQPTLGLDDLRFE